MDVDLNGSSVLVAGISGRLGRVIAGRLEQAGAVVLGIDQPAAEPPRASRFAEADLTDERETIAAFESLTAGGHRIDALIHAVGAWGGAPLTDTGLDDFEKLLRVNLVSTFLCFREAARHWRARDEPGRLVAVASMQGADRGAAQQAAYSAAKAGVVRLVETVAEEYRDANITACAVAPSMILFGSEPTGTRGIEADLVAQICLYLASSGAETHNGSVVRAYGTMF